MQITGSITALATPFAGNSAAIDMGAWERLLRAQLQAGTQGLVVAGSTGEAAALEEDEYEQLLRSAVATVAALVPVIAGTGASATAKAVRATQRAAALGADAALVVAPPYVRPTQEGMRLHFLQIAEEGGLPVLLYNVPARTGCDLLPETVAELAQHPRIIGIKEARCEAERMSALLPLRGPGFVVLSGDDATACRAMLSGADGCISVASNVVPRTFRRLCDSARASMAARAREDDNALAPLHAFLACEPNPTPVKALLGALGACEERLRLPLLPIAAQWHDELHDTTELVRRLEAAAAAEPGRG